MLDWKVSKELRNQWTSSPISSYFQRKNYRTVIFALIACGWISITGGGTALHRSVPNRVPAANLLALYGKLKLEQLSDDAHLKIYSNFALRPRRLCGGWNDDSDDHVISLTGAADHLNNRPNAATPHQQLPNQNGVQDVAEKVSSPCIHLQQPTPCKLRDLTP
jgi:hypothetical protein